MVDDGWWTVDDYYRPPCSCYSLQQQVQLIVTPKRKMMPRKKDPSPKKKDFSDLTEHATGGNGFDPDGLIAAEESGELDEPIIQALMSAASEAEAKAQAAPEEIEQL